MLCAFLAAFSINTQNYADQPPKVAVIGAGLGGLTAAYRLNQQGYNVDVYEARERVGGRVFTVTLNGKIGELGGMNIADGGEAKHIRQLVSELGLELQERTVPLSHQLFYENQIISAIDLLKEIFKRFDNDPEQLKAKLLELSETSKNMAEVLDQLFEKDDLLHRIFSVELAAYEGGSVENLSTIYIDTLYYMMLGGLSSAHKNDEDHSIRRVSVKGGNALLAEKLADKLSNIYFKKILKSVSQNSNGQYLLSFEDGEKTEADILILAIPCSVFNDIEFNNTIPSNTLEAIKNVKYGENAKILFPFDEAPRLNIGFFNHRSVSFFNINLDVLTVYYTGQHSYFNKLNIKDLFHPEHLMIQSWFGNACPKCETISYVDDLNYKSYQGIVGYSWPQDSFAKGSYSYIACGQEEVLTAYHEVDGELVRSLFEPIDQLYFAGEHASILQDVPGTMEAACESGERVARMIVKSQNKNK